MGSSGIGHDAALIKDAALVVQLHALGRGNESCSMQHPSVWACVVKTDTVHIREDHAARLRMLKPIGQFLQAKLRNFVSDAREHQQVMRSWNRKA